MKVGLDMDGVIYNFVQDLRTYLAGFAGKSLLNMPEPTQWNFWDEWGLTFNEFKFCVELGIVTGKLFSSGPIYEGAEKINELHKQGHGIHILTHRDHRTEDRTRKWFKTNGIKVDSITLNGDKTSEEFDVYFDDKPENVEAVREAGRIAYLVRRPWNESSPLVGVVDSWDKIVEVVTFLDQYGEDGRTLVKGWLDESESESDGVSDTGGHKGVKPERMSLVPYEGTAAIARVFGFGAEKYDAHNWRKGYPFSWSIDALERHIGKYKAGEDIDPESGEPHLAHAGAHIMFLLTWSAHLDTYGRFDDRYDPESEIVTDKLSAGKDTPAHKL